MPKEKLNRLKALVKETAASSKSSFYREHWGDASALDLPLMTKEKLAATPLSDRCYTQVPNITRVIPYAESSFFMRQDLASMRTEMTSVLPLARPLVLSENFQEAMERSFWCYEQNMVPAIGEYNNPAITAYVGYWRRAAAIITDAPKLIHALLEEAHGDSLQTTTDAIVLVGSSHRIEEIATLDPVFPNTQKHIILSLPETGPFAYACAEALQHGNLHYHEDDCSVVEIVNEGIVVSKLHTRATPVIRYQTDLAATPVSCQCGKHAFSMM